MATGGNGPGAGESEQVHERPRLADAAARSVGVVGGPSTQAGWRSLDALHGSQFYEIRDVDGFAYATLDTVPVSGHAAVYVSVWVHVSADDWEADDFARVWATAEAGGPHMLLRGSPT